VTCDLVGATIWPVTIPWSKMHDGTTPQALVGPDRGPPTFAASPSFGYIESSKLRCVGSLVVSSLHQVHAMPPVIVRI